MRARVRAVSSECARACTHVRAYEGDRPTEIKSTSGRARGERPRSAYLLLLARRGAGEPAGESHLSAHASSYPFPPFCLSLALSIPLALTRVSQSSSSVYLAPRYLLFFLALYLSHSPSLSLSLSADYSPSLEYTISLFSLLPLSSPRTNGAHHLWPCHALRYPARATSVPFDRDEREPFKITCDCSFSRNEDKRYTR